MSRSNRADDSAVRAAAAVGLLLLAAAAFGLLAAGCQRQSRSGQSLPDVELSYQIEPSPPVAGPAVATFRLTDASGAPLSVRSFDLRGDMTHAGMVPVLAQGTEVSPGEVRCQFEWSMAGDWVLSVAAVLSDGRSLNRTIELSVEAAP